MKPSVNLRMAALAAGLLVATGVAHADLIANGDFEQPVVAAGGYQLFATGTSFPGWRVIGAPGNVAPISGAYRNGAISFPAQDGAQWLDLTGLSNTATGIEQTVTTVPGTAYDLNFYVGNVVAPPGWGNSSAVEVLVDGRSVGLATNSGGAGLNMQVWQKFSMTFTATGSATTIAFINRDPPTDNTNGLDHVTLTVHGQAQTACAPSPAPAKKFNPFAAIGAIAGGMTAIKQAASGGTRTAEQTANTANQTASAAGLTADALMAAGATGAPSGVDCSPATALSGGSDRGPAPGAAIAVPVSTTGGSAATVSSAAVIGSAELERGTATDAAPVAASRPRSGASRQASLDTPELITSSAPAPAASGGPARPMPDVAGLRLGMAPAEAHAALQQRYPKAKLSTNSYDLVPVLPATQKFLESFYIGYQEQSAPQERFIVHFTPPPGKQTAWRVRRELNRQQIYRANVIASLREKYGKESAAFYGGMPATDERQMNTLWWVLDAQGHPAALPNVAGNQLFGVLDGCAQTLTDSRDEPGHIPFVTSDVADPSSDFGAAHRVSAWCESAGILLRAEIDGTEIVYRLLVEAVDMPAALRAAREEGNRLRAIVSQRQQQQIDAAKRASPSL